MLVPSEGPEKAERKSSRIADIFVQRHLKEISRHLKEVEDLLFFKGGGVCAEKSFKRAARLLDSFFSTRGSGSSLFSTQKKI